MGDRTPEGNLEGHLSPGLTAEALGCDSAGVICVGGIGSIRSEEPIDEKAFELAEFCELVVPEVLDQQLADLAQIARGEPMGLESLGGLKFANAAEVSPIDVCALLDFGIEFQG